jgi:exocyst complex component 4
MIEELHDHLYLKSPYCDTLWSAYIKDQQDLPLSTIKVKTSQNEVATETQNSLKELFSGDNADMVRKCRLKPVMFVELIN